MDWSVFTKWRELEWAGTQYAWLGWLVLAAALWGPVRALAIRPWHFPHRLPGATGRGFKASFWSRLAWLPGSLRVAGLALLWLALMRPQIVNSATTRSVQALDIYLCLDISGSMQADDVKPSRLAAAKRTLKNFVANLKGDRVGLVVFKSKAFVQCPLSLDHGVVDYFIDQVDLNTIRIDGTAVGDGILTAVSRLMKDPGRNQVIILATDGVNNAGEDPVKAARLAAATGIKVYTIGIGRKGGALMTFRDPWGRVFQQHLEEPDEEALKRIADLTGGQYYRATDERALDSIYARIGDLERREVKVHTRRDAQEHYFPLLALGALCLGAEALLRWRIRVMA
jgi:Ca-activated chloride channel family protein